MPFFTVFKNTLFQLVSRSITTSTNFVIILLVAKSLGSFGLGQYNKVFAFIGIFAIAVDFGLNATFLKREKEKELFSLITLRLILALFLYLAIQPVIFLLPYDAPSHTGFSYLEKWAIELVGTVFFIYAFVHSFHALFQKWERFDLAIVPNIAYGVLAISLSFVAFFTKNLMLFFAATIFGLMLYAIFAGFAIKVRKSIVYTFRIEAYVMRELFARSLPLGFMLLLNALYVRADVLILSFFRPTEQVGIYTLAYKFFEFPLNLSFFMMNALYPLLLRSQKAGSKVFYSGLKKTTAVIVGISVIIMLVAFVGAPLITMIKNDFSASVEPFRILSVSYPIFFLSNVLLWVSVVEGKEKMLPFIYGVSLLVNVLLNIIFVPTFGYVASAWVTVGSETIVLLMLVYYLIIKGEEI